MPDNSEDAAPEATACERGGDRLRAWLPEWFTDTTALFMIIACLVLLLIGV